MEKWRRAINAIVLKNVICRPRQFNTSLSDYDSIEEWMLAKRAKRARVVKNVICPKSSDEAFIPPQDDWMVPLPSPKVYLNDLRNAVINSIQMADRSRARRSTIHGSKRCKNQVVQADYQSVLDPLRGYIREVSMNLPPVQNAILIDSVKEKNLYSACWSYSRMISKGQTPDFESLSIMLDCFSRTSEVNHSFSIMSTILKMGFVPNLKTYLYLLQGLLREDRFEDITTLFRTMEKMGCPPDSATYYDCIICLSDKGCKGVEKAIEIFAELQTKRIKPDLCYKFIIKGCYHNGKIEVALDMYRKMRERNVKPDWMTYKILLPYF